jgi:hypothetical protein
MIMALAIVPWIHRCQSVRYFASRIDVKVIARA